MIHVQLLIISIQYHDYMICYVIRGSKRPKVQNFDHLYPKQENIEKKNAQNNVPNFNFYGTFHLVSRKKG